MEHFFLATGRYSRLKELLIANKALLKGGKSSKTLQILDIIWNNYTNNLELHVGFSVFTVFKQHRVFFNLSSMK